MTAGRLKLASLALVAVVAGSYFLAWSQQWFTVRLDEGDLTVGGDTAAGALPPLALATLALVAALAIAGPGFRVVLAVLESLLGLCALLVAVVALADPAIASASAVSAATGVSVGSAPELVQSSSATVWPALTIAFGALAIVVGLLILVTSRRWPASGRRYSRSRLTNPSSVDDWDALSEGADPTSGDPR